jgi:hypothetical protein
VKVYEKPQTPLDRLLRSGQGNAGFENLSQEDDIPAAGRKTLKNLSQVFSPNVYVRTRPRGKLTHINQG